MKLSIGKKQEATIETIMAPITAIVDQLKTFREKALVDAKVADDEAAAAVARAADLRSEADKAKRLSEKYA